MKNARLKKQLMSIGIQRNDAAAFIRCYRKIQRSDKVELFRAIMNPEPPIQPKIINVVPHSLQVETSVSQDELYTHKAVDLEAIVRERLSRQLADGLMDSGAMIITKQADWFGNTKIRAKVHVVLPGDSGWLR